MDLRNSLSDDAVLQLLGERISRYRLNKNLTQAQLAKEAGVSLSTLNRMESGSSSQINNMVRVLRALNLIENIGLLVPEPPTSPIQQAKLAGKIRQRARPAKPANEHARSTWTWDSPNEHPSGKEDS